MAKGENKFDNTASFPGMEAGGGEPEPTPVAAFFDEPEVEPQYDVHIGGTVTPDMIVPPRLIPDHLLHYLCRLKVPAEQVVTVPDRESNQQETWAVISLDGLGYAISQKSKHPSPRTEVGSWIQGIAAGMRKATRHADTTLDIKVIGDTRLVPRESLPPEAA